MSLDVGVLDGAIPPAENTRLFGHGDAVAFLARSYQSGGMHHALLLEGPQGIGKATLAYRFSHHMLTHPEPGEAPLAVSDPDANSPVLRQLVSGASHNLLHIARPVDAKTGRVKSAITVDEIRRAGHFLSQTSGTGNWRIVIIDPADDMNRSASNAVLKILEEPPKRTVFFVLSHAPGKLLPTIRSRCMPLHLKPLDDGQMRQGLDHLGLSAARDPAVLDAVVSRSEGSLANAILLLRYGGLEIAQSFEEILAAGQGGSKKAVHALADTLTARDREMAYRFFTDYTLERIMGLARDAAQEGNLALAEHWASMAGELQQQLAQTDSYNLDRKQTVLSVFSLMFQMRPA